MTYPQPRTSDQIVSAGATQWRLFTQAVSQGDIYEIDSSATAIALGPESDFAQIGITYLDPSVPNTSQATVRITPQLPFPGRISPRLDTSYPLSPPRKGRVLVSLIDNFNIGYLPAGFNVTSMQKFQVPAFLDLIGWQGNPPLTVAKRGDKQYEFQEHPATVHANGAIWYIIPSFGRKYASFSLFNNTGGDVTYENRGVNFSTVSNPNPVGPGPRDDAETTLVASGVVATGTTRTDSFPASTKGMFDAYAVFLGTAAGGTISNCPLRVYLSDDAM